MAPPVRHIIRSQHIDVRYNGITDGYALQQMINSMNEKLVTRLEKILDLYDEQDSVISLDSVVINIEGLSEEDLGNGMILEKIAAQFESQIKDRIKPAGRQSKVPGRITIRLHFFRTWTFYLEHGFLPWWGNALLPEGGEGLPAREERIHASGVVAVFRARRVDGIFPVFSAEEKELLKPALLKPTAVSRLTTQLLGAGLFWEFIRLYTALDTAALRVWEEDIDTLLAMPAILYKEDIRRRIMSGMLQSLPVLPSVPFLYQPWCEQIRHILAAVNGVTEEVFSRMPPLKNAVLRAMLGDVFDGTARKRTGTDRERGEAEKAGEDVYPPGEKKEHYQREDANPVPGKEPSNTGAASVSADDGIYIDNAGIVIAAAYLQRFFMQTDLLDNDRVMDVPKAVSLLQYLVKGREDFEEYEVVLFKILCGVMPEEFVLPVQLTGEDKAQGDILLEALIGNWGMLKNTSVQGLRASFLQREGKLWLEDDTWYVKVQPQSYDLLLQYLPWSFGMIKLPWMPRLLIVEWS